MNDQPMTRDEIDAAIARLLAPVEITLTREDLNNITIALARAVKDPRPQDYPGCWDTLLSKLCRISTNA